jgi:hypothetical protein
MQRDGNVQHDVQSVLRSCTVPPPAAWLHNASRIFIDAAHDFETAGRHIHSTRAQCNMNQDGSHCQERSYCTWPLCMLCSAGCVTSAEAAHPSCWHQSHICLARLKRPPDLPLLLLELTPLLLASCCCCCCCCCNGGGGVVRGGGLQGHGLRQLVRLAAAAS